MLEEAETNIQPNHNEKVEVASDDRECEITKTNSNAGIPISNDVTDFQDELKTSKDSLCILDENLNEDSNSHKQNSDNNNDGNEALSSTDCLNDTPHEVTEISNSTVDSNSELQQASKGQQVDAEASIDESAVTGAEDVSLLKTNVKSSMLSDHLEAFCNEKVKPTEQCDIPDDEVQKIVEPDKENCTLAMECEEEEPVFEKDITSNSSFTGSSDVIEMSKTVSNQCENKLQDDDVVLDDVIETSGSIPNKPDAMQCEKEEPVFKKEVTSNSSITGSSDVIEMSETISNQCENELQDDDVVLDDVVETPDLIPNKPNETSKDKCSENKDLNSLGFKIPQESVTMLNQPCELISIDSTPRDEMEISSLETSAMNCEDGANSTCNTIDDKIKNSTSESKSMSNNAEHSANHIKKADDTCNQPLSNTSGIQSSLSTSNTPYAVHVIDISDDEVQEIVEPDKEKCTLAMQCEEEEPVFGKDVTSNNCVIIEQGSSTMNIPSFQLNEQLESNVLNLQHSLQTDWQILGYQPAQNHLPSSSIVDVTHPEHMTKEIEPSLPEMIVSDSAQDNLKDESTHIPKQQGRTELASQEEVINKETPGHTEQITELIKTVDFPQMSRGCVVRLSRCDTLFGFPNMNADKTITNPTASRRQELKNSDQVVTKNGENESEKHASSEKLTNSIPVFGEHFTCTSELSFSTLSSVSQENKQPTNIRSEKSSSLLSCSNVVGSKTTENDTNCKSTDPVQQEERCKAMLNSEEITEVDVDNVDDWRVKSMKRKFPAVESGHINTDDSNSDVVSNTTVTKKIEEKETDEDKCSSVMNKTPGKPKVNTCRKSTGGKRFYKRKKRNEEVENTAKEISPSLPKIVVSDSAEDNLKDEGTKSASQKETFSVERQGKDENIEGFTTTASKNSESDVLKVHESSRTDQYSVCSFSSDESSNEIIETTNWEKQKANRKVSVKTQTDISMHYVNKFECMLCMHPFPDCFSLKEHFVSHLKDIVRAEVQINQNHVCVFCDKPMHSNESLKFHIQKKHVLFGNANNPCKLCSAYFVTAKDLETHVKSYHNSTPFSTQAVICQSPSRIQINNPTTSRETADTREQSADDGKSLSSGSDSVSLKRKLRGKPDISPPPAKEPRRSTDLKKSGPLPGANTNIRFLRTGKKLEIGAGQTRISVVHENKIFKCPSCVRTFANKAQVTRHETMYHKNVQSLRDVTCKFCKLYFSSNSSLQQHIKTVHPSANTRKNPHVCKTCSETFPLASHLDQHIRRGCSTEW